jgi:hypothetical protein
MGVIFATLGSRLVDVGIIFTNGGKSIMEIIEI